MTDCNRCGECCQNIPLSTTKAKLREKLTSLPPTSPNHVDAAFIVEHWHGGRRDVEGGTRGWTCDRFDPVARLCTAHEERPPICSGYPWYDRSDVSPEKTFADELMTKADRFHTLHLRCSFWADVPEAQRPAAWVPLELGATR